ARGGAGSAALRRRPRRRRGRDGCLLPAAGRARGVLAAARPGRDDTPPAGHLGLGAGGGRRARGGDRCVAAREARPVNKGGGAKERRMVPPAEPRSYYGRPVIKEPVWKPEIPFYFFTGGLAGASAGLAFGA